MIDLRNGKKQLDLEMRKLADQKFDLETQIASYEFKHKSLEELLATLKDGQTNSRVQKMIEWQQKLEKVKLNELRHIRLNKRMDTDVSFTLLEEENKWVPFLVVEFTFDEISSTIGNQCDRTGRTEREIRKGNDHRKTILSKMGRISLVGN